MKILILVFFLFKIASARQIICQQNPRDVAVKVSQDSHQLNFQIYSPMGYEQLPMLEGPIRPAMKSWINYQFQQLKGLGSDFIVHFLTSKCEWSNPKNSSFSSVQCSEALPTNIKNLRFHTLSVSQVVERGLKQESNYRKFRLTVSAVGDFGEDTFFISLQVPEQACKERE